MSRNLPSSSGLMKSTLRDTVKRLKKIRVKAGKQDDEDKKQMSTGDPFRDKNNEFIEKIKKTKELISERNVGLNKNGLDPTCIAQNLEIKKELRALQVILGEIKAMVDEADRALAKENRKKSPKESKVKLLERQLKDRETQHKQCGDMLEMLSKLDSERLDPQGKKDGMKLGQEGKLGQKAKLREQLNLNTLKARAERNKKPAAGEGGEGGDQEMTGNGDGGGGGNINTDAETKKHMQELAQQESLINKGLDELSNNVKNLHQLAMDIGSQLDLQNSMLDSTEQTVDKQTNQLTGINRTLNKVLKAQSPMNTCITVACIGVLLALVGFFLMQFNVI